MKCKSCNGECCYVDKREGTTRYAQLVPHGQGVHWCRHCADGWHLAAPEGKVPPIDELLEKVATQDAEIQRLRSQWIELHTVYLKKINEFLLLSAAVAKWPEMACSDDCADSGGCVCDATYNNANRAVARSLAELAV